jgi:hypothetical protein
MVAAEDGVLTKGQIEKIAKEPSDARAVEMAVDAVMAQLEKLEAHHERPDVVMVSLPVKLIERVWRNERARDDEGIEGEAADAKAGRETSPNFRGLLKARAMDLRFSIQIVWEDVINPGAKIPRKIKENSDRQTQDRADLAWNLMTTLYYKGSGKVPWRRLPEEGEFTACYIGISFFKDAETDEIWTSAAQMFDERGRGFILRGGPAQSESRGRHPFLTIDEAHKLTESALAAYKSVHRTMPARVIVMKTSRFREDEAEGVGKALDEAGVDALKIPHATLIDLDLGRSHGGANTIRATVGSLAEIGNDLSNNLDVMMEVVELANLPALSDEEMTDGFAENNWMQALKDEGVFFSDPLDLDFAMLAAFPDAYKELDPGAHGPDDSEEALERKKAATLKKGGNAGLYDPEWDDCFIWYPYLFLSRSKPETHLAAINRIPKADLAANAPPELCALVQHVKMKLDLENGAD